MICYRIPLLMPLLLLSAAGLRAQPAPPAPPRAPIPVTPAEPPEPPVPPLPPDFGPDLAQLNVDVGRIAAEAAQMARVNLGNAFFQRGFYGASSDDRLYEQGQRALDRSQWDQALSDFSQVAGRGGARADGALYWKAYTLNKLGRRDEAMAAIADLRKSYAKSRWLDDANALELEVKQAAGQPVSPDSQPDEELKLMALNALVNSDPDRALPILENLLKGSQPPRLKERALFVLAQSGSARAQQLLEQVARGNGNPDLQLKAIQYLGISRQQSAAPLLAEVYSAAADNGVKRAVINALVAQERSSGKTLVDLARKERDPELKREIVGRLSVMKSKEATDYLMELLK
jgi:HEAT repeats